ncbi:MAG: hypothetical protein M3680_22770 [Myxococcota bacterium]|nr:hypothetical protein [Myxococcota bacterium]
MHLLRLLTLLALLGACETEEKGGSPDADLAAPVCPGVVYDNCTTDAQCMSGMCHLFSGEFQVCTQACTANDNSTCPTSGGEAAKCNMRGICKPTINNACRPPS